MESFFDQLKEYLKMDTEIPYEEFADFHHKFLEYLNEAYEGLAREELIKASYIFSIIQANSFDRSRRKDSFAKKYKKIADKAKFWTEAIKFRLEKDGMTAREIDEAHAALMESAE